MRIGTFERETRETRIRVRLDLDGSGQTRINTGVGFFDHMLELLACHGGLDLEVEAHGDLQVDEHHLVEDVGIVLGRALAEALGDKSGLERYGWAALPMDEVLVLAAVDLGGRFHFASEYRPVRERVGNLSTELVNHFFRSLAAEARMNLHLRLLDPGENEHHRVEALFKAFARALRMAAGRTSGREAVIPSTKGVL